MRKILFRGKRTDNGEWVEGYFMPRPNNPGGSKTYIVTVGRTVWCEVDPETVCQFTGLTDKNGVKIFEGDVVKSYDLYGTYDGKGMVHWSDLFLSWHFGECKSLLKLYKYEVIGNIFDNPELVKGGAE